MIDLADALVDRGYFVHHVFVGDPKLPAREERADGRLILERWSQWISAYHPRDVYDGEDGKWRDFSRTVPAHLANLVIASAAEGRKSVLLFEDWQTADAAIAVARSRVAASVERATRSIESPRVRMRAPTMSPYGLRLPRIRSRGRAPVSRMKAIASIAQSQRLS